MCINVVINEIKSQHNVCLTTFLDNDLVTHVTLPKGKHYLQACTRNPSYVMFFKCTGLFKH